MLALTLTLFATNTLWSQEITRDDELRGPLTAERSCYDVISYDLSVRIDPENRHVEGRNIIEFRATADFTRMQVDLFANMSADEILLDGDQEVVITREENSMFLDLPNRIVEGSQHSLTISYSGNPIVARRPPWNGGFTWAEDSEGNPWVAVTSQGTGASLWWPHKDHPSDEPESMMLRVTVPPGLQDVSNGRLVEVDEIDGWTTYHWKISYPINNYNVTINVGKFAHFSDEYESLDGTLTLDYYVLPQNLEIAKTHFEQTKTMLEAFEKYFGAYPFIDDGFKMIESPHLGMEHQSAIAYGNGYQGGYLGRSPSEVGRRFDFIIIHEAAHEWWGNNVSMSDRADLWIHESFGAYAESLYVEHVYGYEDALTYINAKKSNVRNRGPMIGEYGSNHSGSGDMYDKGQLVLNTLRSVIDDDDTWFEILLGLQTDFRYTNVEAEEVINYINEKSGTDFNYFFDQYYRHASIPVLDLALGQDGDNLRLRYRWVVDVEEFGMPVKVTSTNGEFEFIYPTKDWQEIELEGVTAEEFEVAEDLFYIQVMTRPASNE